PRAAPPFHHLSRVASQTNVITTTLNRNCCTTLNRMRLPTISKRLNIFYREIFNKRAPTSLPAIAINAAGELLTIMFNLNHGLVAAVAVHGYASRRVPSLASFESRSCGVAAFAQSGDHGNPLS